LAGMGAGIVAGAAGCTGGNGGGSNNNGGGETTTSSGGGEATTTTTSSGSNEPITVGILAPLNYQQGKDIRDGARLAVEHINADGGVNGRQLETVLKDYKGDPSKAKQRHRELILQDNADVTTGIFGGAAMLNILDNLAQLKKIHFTNGAATNELEPKIRNNYEKYKYHFRTVQDSIGGAENRLAFMKDQFGGSTVGILYEDYKWTKPFEDVWGNSDAFDIAYQTRFSGKTEDFSPFYDKMENMGVEHCFVAMAFVGTNALTQWARQERSFTFGGNHNFMQSSDYWKKTDGLTQYGWTNTAYLPGVYFNDASKRFLTDFQSSYNRLPTYTGGTSYEAVHVWSEAVKAAGTMDEEEVIPQLEQQSVPSAFGDIGFYPKGHDKVHDLVYEKGKTWDLMLQWQKADNPSDDLWPGDGKQACVFYEPNTNAEFQTPAWI